MWQFLEATAGYIRTEEYNWEEILRVITKFDLERIIKIASVSLLSKNSEQRKIVAKFLVDLAQSHPDLVMQSVGDIILDDKYGWHFEVEKYRFLI